MAGWLRGRTKLTTLLYLLKDQTSARTSSPFPHLQASIILATNHDESLPEEKYVTEIISAGSGPRLQAAFSTDLLTNRLAKTHSWAVAIKCLVILHRCILDGSFLFQDLLAHRSLKHGKGYLHFEANDRGAGRGVTSSPDSKYAFWVQKYAGYLDERLVCSRAIKSHLDNRYTNANMSTFEFMDSPELLLQLSYLQSLLDDLCQCEPAESEPGEHPVIQGALVLVVTDSFKVYDEIRFRFSEMFARLHNLETFERVRLLQMCKRAGVQMESLERFLDSCKGLRLFSDVPFPGKDMVSEVEVRKLVGIVEGESMKPCGPVYKRRSNSVGRIVFGGEKPFERSRGREAGNNGLAIDAQQPALQRTSSLRMNQFRRPQNANTAPHRHSSADVEDLFQGGSDHNSRYLNKDLIDLSFGSEYQTPSISNTNPVPPAPMRDLITW